MPSSDFSAAMLAVGQIGEQIRDLTVEAPRLEASFEIDLGNKFLGVLAGPKLCFSCSGRA